MIINAFNGAWFLSFALEVVLILAVYFLCKGKSEKYKKNVMTVYYIFLWIFYFAYKACIISFDTIVDGFETCWWNELPFALCQVASLVALPGILLNSNALKGFCFFVAPLCTLMALAMPSEGFYNIPLLSGRAIGFFGFHWLAFGQGILLYATGLYTPKRKDAASSAILLIVFAFFVHWINYFIRANFYPEANYFFTYSPDGNPILAFFRKYIDINFVYLIPLIIPAWLVFYIESLFFVKKKAKQ